MPENGSVGDADRASFRRYGTEVRRGNYEMLRAFSLGSWLIALVIFAAVEALSRQVGKTPVEVNDGPGFVSNRVLLPMINEAVFCLHEGVGTPEAIDTVMKLGMNHPMGPLALADLIGLDTCLAIMEVLYEGFNDSKYRPCPLLKKMVAAGYMGRKSGRGFYQY